MRRGGSSYSSVTENVAIAQREVGVIDDVEGIYSQLQVLRLVKTYILAEG